MGSRKERNLIKASSGNCRQGAEWVADGTKILEPHWWDANGNGTFEAWEYEGGG